MAINLKPANLVFPVEAGLVQTNGSVLSTDASFLSDDDIETGVSWTIADRTLQFEMEEGDATFPLVQCEVTLSCTFLGKTTIYLGYRHSGETTLTLLTSAISGAGNPTISFDLLSVVDSQAALNSLILGVQFSTVESVLGEVNLAVDGAPNGLIHIGDFSVGEEEEDQHNVPGGIVRIREGKVSF